MSTQEIISNSICLSDDIGMADIGVIEEKCVQSAAPLLSRAGVVLAFSLLVIINLIQHANHRVSFHIRPLH